jgi:hypothetical protein
VGWGRPVNEFVQTTGHPGVVMPKLKVITFRLTSVLVSGSNFRTLLFEASLHSATQGVGNLRIVTKL